MGVYDSVRAYHEAHGDDFGSLRTRVTRYDAAISMLPERFGSMLDVGCGSGEFKRWWNGEAHYTGIDLLTGTNVLDYKEKHDVVVALGVLYKVPDKEQSKLLRHMWRLCTQALIVQTITLGDKDEHPVDPFHLFGFARVLTPLVAFRCDYLPNDATVALYREVG